MLLNTYRNQLNSYPYRAICDKHKPKSCGKPCIDTSDELTRHKGTCKGIRREMKPKPVLLDAIREYIFGHNDKETFHVGITYTSIEIIGQYFSQTETEANKVRLTLYSQRDGTEEWIRCLRIVESISYIIVFSS